MQEGVRRITESPFEWVRRLRPPVARERLPQQQQKMKKKSTPDY